MMSRQNIEERRKLLNEKCKECIRQNGGPPSPERCDYYCTVGKEIHELDRENTAWADSEQYQQRKHPWF